MTGGAAEAVDTEAAARGRVAVVIPCYRQAHFLPDALASLQKQTRPPDQIVVVDDGSPDDVAGAAAGFEGVRVVRQENRGLSGARNRGLAEIDAEFVLFLDADDRLLPGALETLADALAARPDAAFAWGFNEPVDADWSPKPWGPTSFEGEPTYARLLETNVVGAPLGVLFRRAHIAAAGGFDTRLDAAEDYEMFVRLARDHPYLCVHEIVAQYRHHDDNMSSDHALMYRTHVEVLRMQEPFVAGRPDLRRALERGLRAARRLYVAPSRVDRFSRAIRERRWGAATREGVGLLIRHPDVVRELLARRLRRHR